MVTLAIGTLVVLGGLVALLAVVTARDDPDLGASEATGPGELRPDRGAGHGAPAPPASELPTSGPHRAREITSDTAPIDGDELLHALELGNVVLAYSSPRPARALREVQREVAGRFDPEIAAAGQSVILARIPGMEGVAALAWRRSLETGDPADPALRAFAETWLGRGAPR